MSSVSPHALKLREHFDETAQGGAPVDAVMTPAPPSPEKPAPVDVLPMSLYLMSKMFEAIINTNYSRRAGDIGVHAFIREDGMFGIGFYPVALNDLAQDENAVFDIYEDPDYYNAVRSFMTDLSEFAVGTDVDIMMSACGFVSTSKLGMYRMLSEYISDPQYALSTPDSTFLSGNNFDPEIEDQQRAERVRQHDRIIREVFEALPRYREMSDQIDPLFVANNTPVASLSDFHHICFISANADLPCAMSHIFQTICQEDKLDRLSYRHIRVGERLTYGGYH